MGRTSLAARVRRQNKERLTGRNEAIEAMNGPLKKRFHQIEKLLGDSQDSTMQFYYKLGRLCQEVRDDAETFEKHGFRKLERAMWVQAASLRKAAVFANSYTEQDVTKLANLRHEEYDYRIHWGHMTYLLSVPDKKDRWRLAELAVKEMWDPPTLQRQIKKELGARSSGGAKHKLPAGVSAQVKQILDMSRVLHIKLTTLWAGEEINVFSNVAELSPERYTPQLLEDLTGICQLFQDLHGAIFDALAQAGTTREHVEQALSRLAEAAAALQAEQAQTPLRQIHTNGNGVQRARTLTPASQPG